MIITARFILMAPYACTQAMARWL